MHDIYSRQSQVQETLAIVTESHDGSFLFLGCLPSGTETPVVQRIKYFKYSFVTCLYFFIVISTVASVLVRSNQLISFSRKKGKNVGCRKIVFVKRISESCAVNPSARFAATSCERYLRFWIGGAL